jgi:CheY-like chemotaxis protein
MVWILVFMIEEVAGGSKHIVVVVEDEALIRIFICEALADAGFDVVEAQHADEALALLRLRAKEIHALFTDIHMPGSMDGMALAHLAQKSWPWVALLITSGQARPKPDDMPVASRFVSKPYHSEHVIDHLREMLVG